MNELATTFKQVSHEDNYSEEFKRNKASGKKENLTSPRPRINMESYNKEFSIHELQVVIKRAKATSPGPDKISNLMLKNAPEGAQKFLKDDQQVLEGRMFLRKMETGNSSPNPKTREGPIKSQQFPAHISNKLLLQTVQVSK